jgi:hypothetical protein
MFLYILTNTQLEDICYIGLSRTPFARIDMHNRRPGLRSGPKVSKRGAGNHIASLIIGPIPKSLCIEYRDCARKTMRKKLRKITNVIQRAEELGLRISALCPQEARQIYESSIGTLMKKK